MTEVIFITKEGISGQPIAAKLLADDLAKHDIDTKFLFVKDGVSFFNRCLTMLNIVKLVLRNKSKKFFIIHLNLESLFLQLFFKVENAVFVNHGIKDFSQPQSIYRNILLIMYKISLKRGNKIFFVNYEQHQLLQGSDYLPNKVDYCGLKYKDRCIGGEFCLHSVGFVGRNNQQKNLLVLEPIIKRHSDIEFFHLSVEPISLFEKYKNYVHVKSEERSWFFENIDLLLMPSKYESFGMVAYEALYSGILVLHSGEDGLRHFNNGKNLHGSSIDIWKSVDLHSIDYRSLDLYSNDVSELGLYRNKSIEKITNYIFTFYNKIKT
ncbi:MAG: glycosyltransferase family 1 protein [Spirobacillus cienkowskii]|jgi:hypothetical protein|uniref:Glycosyltransferase family 1 protein n=1 Tax=Spirobacillus cienkowskii TaxID=495820 RepID=A0A369KQG5_9BACT|nr:MAG: glycosyltransferase family 1 protein [Spirobacillus cienkowskii]